MANTQAFMQLRALSTPVRAWPHREMKSTKPNHIVCKAQNQDVQDSDPTTLSLLSRRLALGTALIGGAAVAGTKTSPADATIAKRSLEKPSILLFITSLITQHLHVSFNVLVLISYLGYQKWMSILLSICGMLLEVY